MISFELKLQGYELDFKKNIWKRPNYLGIAYSDGSKVEERLLSILDSIKDLSVLSNALREHCTDWASNYHLSHQRANLLRPFESDFSGDILEIGSGCGAITRYLGECGGNVLSLEGTLIRASITRSRTRDLKNVTVVSDNFDQFTCDKKFDVVTLIGVLEYANLFSKDKNPIQYMLSKANSFLKPNGKLIIAIENQIGLKYFAGAAEDHYGIPMLGIEGRYKTSGIRTFGRTYLKKLLNISGFASCQFYAPFPDYKLVSTIITETGFQCGKFNAATLIAQTVGNYNQLPKLEVFCQETAWNVIQQNKLGMDFANSFLVVASGTELEDRKNVLAWYFNTSRSPKYCKRIKFLKSGSKIVLDSDNLITENTVLINKPITQKIKKKTPYYLGITLQEQLINQSIKEDFCKQDIFEFYKKYLEILKNLVENYTNNFIKNWDFNYLVDGKFFDCIPQNIIKDKNNYQYIDDEWIANFPIEVGYLLFRALLNFKIPYYLNSVNFNFLNTKNFIIKTFFYLDVELTEKKLSEYINLEYSVQSQLNEHIIPFDQYYQNFEKKIIFRSNIFNTLNSLTQVTQAKEQEIVNLTQVTQAKDREINEILNSTCWKITSPLRLVGMFYRWIFARVKMFLHIFKAKISFIKSIIRIHSNSVDNIKALQDLTRRRFNQNKFEKSSGSENPEITISVVTYNSLKWIKPFINSLLKQHYSLEKIHLRFVDSGSSDSTMDELTYRLEENRERFASIKILQQENLGYGAGNDLVLSQALTKLCLVTNVDIEFEVDSILNIVSEAFPNLHNKIASWELRQIPYEHPKYYDPVTLETNWSSHACVLINVDAYKEVGGYDQKIFMYCDDVELSYRFRSYGYCLKYVPSAVVIHNTYDEELNIKPLQFTGSILGNCYIRIRYGKWSDLYIGFILYIYHLIKPGPFPGANRLLLLNLPKLFLNTKHFLKGKGPQKAYFPIRYFDYEMIREGAYYELKTLRKKFIVKKNLPKISVITRTYKGRSVLLQQAMQTVFNQTYKNIELIVTEDGGSTQKHIVEKFSLKAPSGISVKYLSNEKIGRSGAGNTALAKASGEYLMFLDDDDLLFADHIETLVSTLISDKSLSAAYSLAFEVQTSFDADKSNYTEHIILTNANHRQHWDYSTLQKYNFIPIQAIIFKRELYDRLGGFDEELDYLEDWNLWLRFGLGNKFFFVNKTTSLYRTPFDINIRMQRNELLKNGILPAKQKINELRI